MNAAFARALVEPSDEEIARVRAEILGRRAMLQRCGLWPLIARQRAEMMAAGGDAEPAREAA